MTDNEIKKALKCLHKRILKSSFAKYVTETEIMGLVDVFDLLNRNEEMINGLIAGQETLQKGMAEKNAEIERLQEQIGSLNKKYPCTVDVGNNCLVYARSLDDYDNLIGDISAEGIKEFAELVEKTILSQLVCSTSEKKEAYYFCLDEIDTLLKEMEGETNGKQ